MSYSDFSAMGFDPKIFQFKKYDTSDDLFDEEKIYLNVPFEEKDEAKQLGAKWDFSVKRWYYLESDDARKFQKWTVKVPSVKFSDLTDEQQRLIEEVRKGNNVLVDACIGSGKTTTIQVLCNEMPDKNILYLTYNKLLKVDAQAKICQLGTMVNNYHGFASHMLRSAGIHDVGVSDLVRSFVKHKPVIDDDYDILILDEYQDIDREISEMLEHIKSQIPDIQIVAVGDMKQKIYDKTDLDVLHFITSFLGTYVSVNFTKCFRISSDLADMLSRIWTKEINGINTNCTVEVMDLNKAVRYLATCDPSDILCLGAREGYMARALNRLEDEFGSKFNKKTVYASIRDTDNSAVTPTANTAIFTTFDGAKGLERKICVVFDFTEEYWDMRMSKPYVKYDILRNIFCVAASRGKDHIIFVKPERENILSERVLSTFVPTKMSQIQPFLISEMFDFKYKEDVDRCYSMLDIKNITVGHNTVIDVKGNDEMIDLSPCIGIWQEASFFKKYDIDEQIRYEMVKHPDRPRIDMTHVKTVDEKILALTSYQTSQDRYVSQVDIPFITDTQKKMIHDRLYTVFTGDEPVQGHCFVYFRDNVGSPHSFEGLFDAMIGDLVYELKFKSELQHEDFLQVACYCIALEIPKGILWNVKTNDMFEVSVPDVQSFLDSVVYTITKRSVSGFRKIRK